MMFLGVIAVRIGVLFLLKSSEKVTNVYVEETMLVVELSSSSIFIINPIVATE